MLKKLQLFQINFVRCGVAGWCMEILFTSLHAFFSHDFKLKGNTSIWMFPIYGCAAFLSPVSRLLKNRSVWQRGLTYMSLIFSVEYLSGSLLKRRGLCPWDYGDSLFHINRLIRLDYAPIWFGTGLFFEQFLLKSHPHRP